MYTDILTIYPIILICCKFKKILFQLYKKETRPKLSQICSYVIFS